MDVKTKIPSVDSSATVEAAAQQGRKKKRVTLYLDADIYTQFSKICGQEDVGLSAVVEELIKGFNTDRASISGKKKKS